MKKFNGATAIEQVASQETKASTGIYTINGIRVQKTTKGLYIINGKKVMGRPRMMQKDSPRAVIIGQNEGGCVMKPALIPAPHTNHIAPFSLSEQTFHARETSLKPTPGIQPLSFNSVVCVHQASFWSRGVGLACWVLALRTRLSVSGVICRKLAICTMGARSTISGFSLRRRS